jgi:hypothetical protein
MGTEIGVPCHTHGVDAIEVTVSNDILSRKQHI